MNESGGSRVASTMRTFLEREAATAGFDAVAVTAPDSVAEAGGRLMQALADGHHGSMAWMADKAGWRADPRALWPQVRAIVIFAMNYGPHVDPLETLGRADRATISVYARNRDYHDVMKGRLKEIGQKFARRFGEDVKVFVDTAPVMEKPLAAAAGIGWQGKHTNLVSRAFGSWLFLGAMFTTAPLDPDIAETDHCGSCRACLDICPTSAFPEPYRLDARRCISYLTIENKGPIPLQFRVAMGNRIYGCDDCLAVCPWNKFASVAREAKLVARDDLTSPPLSELLALDDAAFRARFSGSPIKRIGRGRFLRNVLIATGNSGDCSLLPLVNQLLADSSPLVRGAAVWALSRLDDPRRVRESYDRAFPVEADADVRGEWSDAIRAAGEAAKGEVA